MPDALLLCHSFRESIADLISRLYLDNGCFVNLFLYLGLFSFFTTVPSLYIVVVLSWPCLDLILSAQDRTYLLCTYQLLSLLQHANLISHLILYS